MLHPVTVSLRRRGALLLVFVLLAAIGLSYRLYTWQVTDAATLAASAVKEHMMQVPIDAPRGRIYDAEGNVLVTNVTFSRIYAVPPDVSDPVMTATRLAPVLGMSVTQLLPLLQATEDYVTLARKVDPDVRDQVLALNLPGIHIEPDVKRVYPNGALAAQVLGFTNYNGDGNYGLEQYYNNILTGKPGELRAMRDALGNEIDLNDAVEIAPVSGEDLQLTIDGTIQYDAEQVLQEGVQQHGAQSGSVVVLDPYTGAILAMANYPTYDPNQFQSYSDDRFINGAVSTPFEPGSTFKLITMSTALEHGVVTPETTTYDPGYLTIYGATVHDWDRQSHGIVTMRTVLDDSLNVGAAFVARRTGANLFYQGVHAFGFARPTGVDLQGEASGGVLTNGEPGWYPIQLVTNSFGQGLTATPLQMAMAVAAIANGGSLMKPYMVKEITAPSGVQITQPVVVGHPISPATSATMINMMEEVVRIGEGTEAQIPGYVVAGKTGTAQIAVNGTYSMDATMASFVGFVPAEHPAFLIYIVLNHPTDSPYGSETATPMFSELAERILVHLGIAPTVPIAAPTPVTPQ